MIEIYNKFWTKVFVKEPRYKFQLFRGKRFHITREAKFVISHAEKNDKNLSRAKFLS